MAPITPLADGSLAEKLAHQSIRLAGDVLAASDPSAPTPLPHSVPQQASPSGFSLPTPRQGAARSTAQLRRSPLPPQPAPAAAAAAGTEPAAEPAGDDSRSTEAQHHLAELHAQQWQALARSVLSAAVAHSSPLVRSAGFAAVGGLSPGAFGALPPALQLQMLQWCCGAAAGDDSSPSRAAAAKALAALCSSSAWLALPHGERMHVGVVG